MKVSECPPLGPLADYERKSCRHLNGLALSRLKKRVLACKDKSSVSELDHFEVLNLDLLWEIGCCRRLKIFQDGRPCPEWVPASTCP
jgi:hypothetical protein